MFVNSSAGAVDSGSIGDVGPYESARLSWYMFSCGVGG
jgi:hypothetical protein